MSGLEITLRIIDIYSFIIFGRIIVSWIPMFTQKPVDMSNPLVRFLFDVTEPLLAPIRRFALVGQIDLSPMVAIFTLIIIRQILESSLE